MKNEYSSESLGSIRRAGSRICWCDKVDKGRGRRSQPGKAGGHSAHYGRSTHEGGMDMTCLETQMEAK